jgi:hypothetical protein
VHGFKPSKGHIAGNWDRENNSRYETYSRPEIGSLHVHSGTCGAGKPLDFGPIGTSAVEARSRHLSCTIDNARLKTALKSP